MKIQLNNKSKLNNPIDFVSEGDSDYVYSYEGSFDSEMFLDHNTEQYQYLKFQVNNFKNLIETLNRLDLNFEYIWMNTFKNDENHNSNNFLIKTNKNHLGMCIYWRKYITKNIGSGQNNIYLVWDDKKEKMQLTKWLDGNHEEKREEFLNSFNLI